MQTLTVSISRRLRPRGEQARRVIASAIQSQAGIRYRELARMTGVAHGTLSHHVKMLERQGLIRTRRDSGSTRFFPESYDDDICSAIALTSHPTTMAIMALLLTHECDNRQIKRALARSGSTICDHLRRLRSAGVISRRRTDKVWIYGITDIDKATMILNRGAMVVKR